eukprot:1011368-Prorocentrum_minimum.AAC.1
MYLGGGEEGAERCAHGRCRLRPRGDGCVREAAGSAPRAAPAQVVRAVRCRRGGSHCCTCGCGCSCAPHARCGRDVRRDM